MPVLGMCKTLTQCNVLLQEKQASLSFCKAHSPERAIKFNSWCIRNEEVMCAKESLYTHTRRAGGLVAVSRFQLFLAQRTLFIK
jgi:hypothetical protein